MLSASGRNVGNCTLTGQDIVCTFSQRLVLGGKITLSQQFYDSTVDKPNTVVPTTYNVNGTPDTNIDMTVSPNTLDPQEILTKFGEPKATGIAVGNKIEWFARVNCRADNITNMTISDVIQLGHSIDPSTIFIEEGTCTSGANGQFNREAIIYDANPSSPTTDSRVVITPATATNGGSITITNTGTTNKAYQIQYETTITSIQSEWHNIIDLSGNSGSISNIDAKVSQEILTAIGYLSGETGGISKIPSLGFYAMLLMMLSIAGIALAQVKRRS